MIENIRKWHVRSVGVLVGCALFIAGCSKDSCREYSDHTCAELEKASFNVYVYPPNGEREHYVGVSSGLSSCGAMAHGFAADNHFQRSNEWSYICCLKTDTSECAEKHR